MQVPLHLLLGGREDWFPRPLDTQPSHCPDERLSAVLSSVEGKEFDWSWITRDVDPRWLTASPPDPYGSRDHKRDYHTILIRAYHQYAWALSRRDIPVLAWDTHLRYRTIPIFSRLDPGVFPEQHLSPPEVEALEGATAALSNKLQIILSSEGQSLHRAAFQTTLRVEPLMEIVSPAPSELNLRDFVHTSPAGLHLIVRPTEAVIASHATSQEQVDLLRAATLDGVVTAVRAVIDSSNGVQTVLGLMTSPPTSSY